MAAIVRSALRLQRAIRLPATRQFSAFEAYLNDDLESTDPELFGIIEKEKERQRDSFCLIASENFTSKSVLEALGSVMSNKYSEGYPKARYYGGNEFIDEAENLCRDRALSAFGLDPEKWGVNVQSLSGTPVNFQVYTALLKPHDRILGLDLPHGGHLSHGYQTPTKKISAVSTYFETFSYRVDTSTGIIDYDECEKIANTVRPKLIIAGASAYPRDYDYARMRKIADGVGAYLLADMAHISGLVAAEAVASPFGYADVVTTTTHKSLRGPRGAMCFFRKGKTGKGDAVYNLEEPINFAVFPGLQGGPHNHTISALATALKQVSSDRYKEYQKQVISNAAAFADELSKLGYGLVSGGTDNHLVLVDVKGSKGVDGARAEHVMDRCNISVNKNTIPTDTSALVPSGIRIGTPAMTSRGFTEEDFRDVAQVFDQAVQLALDINADCPGKKLVDFKAHSTESEPQMKEIRDTIAAKCRDFPTVGF